MLTDHDSWQPWYESIQNLAGIYFVWEYCDPDSTKKYDDQSSDSVRTGLRKILERIDNTVTPKHRILYTGCRTPREQLSNLRQMVEPTTQDRKDSVRRTYDNLIKGPSKSTGINSWLEDWVVLVTNAHQISIENLSEHQICEGFIEASKDINPAFFNQMKTQAALRRQNETALEKQKRTDERFRDVLRLL